MQAVDDELENGEGEGARTVNRSAPLPSGGSEPTSESEAIAASQEFLALDEKHRPAFLRFVDAGELEPALADYIDTSSIAQLAVEKAFKLQLAALRRVGDSLRADRKAARLAASSRVPREEAPFEVDETTEFEGGPKMWRVTERDNPFVIATTHSKLYAERVRDALNAAPTDAGRRDTEPYEQIVRDCHRRSRPSQEREE